jgi:hypothetical protein
MEQLATVVADLNLWLTIVLAAATATIVIAFVGRKRR